MKRFVLITAALGALVATGAAVAHLKAADVTAASATLSATTPSNVQTRTYTCDGQTFEITTGRWSGTATSTTADLNGAAVVPSQERLQRDQEARLGRRPADHRRR